MTRMSSSRMISRSRERHSQASLPVHIVTYFTLVRHSGFSVGSDPRFEEAVEVAEITQAQMYLARSAGGTIFTDRDIAQARADATNDTTPGRPRLRGHFSSLRVNGANLFIQPGTMPGTMKD